MTKFVFEPHNLHGETIDGEAMPFGYITQIQESGHRLPVFELNTVFGDMPGIDLAGLARAMAEAAAMAAMLRGIDRDEDGDAMLDASGMDEIAAILSRIDGAGDTLPDAPVPAPTTDAPAPGSQWVSAIIRKNWEPRLSVFPTEEDLREDLLGYARAVLDIDDIEDNAPIGDIADRIGEEARDQVYWGRA